MEFFEKFDPHYCAAKSKIVNFGEFSQFYSSPILKKPLARIPEIFAINYGNIYSQITNVCWEWAICSIEQRDEYEDVKVVRYRDLFPMREYMYRELMEFYYIANYIANFLCYWIPGYYKEDNTYVPPVRMVCTDLCKLIWKKSGLKKRFLKLRSFIYHKCADFVFTELENLGIKFNNTKDDADEPENAKVPLYCFYRHTDNTPMYNWRNLSLPCCSEIRKCKIKTGNTLDCAKCCMIDGERVLDFCVNTDSKINHWTYYYLSEYPELPEDGVFDFDDVLEISKIKERLFCRGKLDCLTNDKTGAIVKFSFNDIYEYRKNGHQLDVFIPPRYHFSAGPICFTKDQFGLRRIMHNSCSIYIRHELDCNESDIHKNLNWSDLQYYEIDGVLDVIPLYYELYFCIMKKLQPKTFANVQKLHFLRYENENTGTKHVIDTELYATVDEERRFLGEKNFARINRNYQNRIKDELDEFLQFKHFRENLTKVYQEYQEKKIRETAVWEKVAVNTRLSTKDELDIIHKFYLYQNIKGVHSNSYSSEEFKRFRIEQIKEKLKSLKLVKEEEESIDFTSEAFYPLSKRRKIE